MLHKIQLLFLFSLLSSFSLSASAEDNEIFANMACTFISHNRSILHCELQQTQIIVIRTTDGKELKLLCVWFPQTRVEEHRLGDVTVSLKQKVDIDRVWANSWKSYVLLLSTGEEDTEESENR